MATKGKGSALRKIYTSLGIVAVLGLLVCFYYYYVSNKEYKIEERNFRVLHRIEINLKKRIDDNRQLFLSRLKACRPSCFPVQNKVNINCLKDSLQQDESFLQITDTTGEPKEWSIISEGSKSQISYFIRMNELVDDEQSKRCLRVDASMDNILADVLRHDVFNSYVLTSQNAIVYNSCKEVCEIPRGDSMMKSDNVREMHIGAGSYYIFSHPFSFGTGRGIILNGLISSADYSHIKYGVPGNFLLIVLLICLVILLAFPFIKSFLVSVEETLNTGDILLALLSLFLLCYIYTFVQMYTYTSIKDDQQKKTMLQTSSDSIKNRFITELLSMRQQLNYYDHLFAPAYASGTNARKTGVVPFLKPPSFSDYYRPYWLNAAGLQVAEIKDTAIVLYNTDSAKNFVDYQDRNYFKAVANDELWLPWQPDSNRFFLQSIYSRTDGTFRAVMSKHSTSPSNIAVISTQLNSVINTVQPPELNYCVLDKEGNILFTSAGNEHINENLIEECGNSNELKAALNTRSSTFIDHSFVYNSTSFYISPVNDIPLYIATYTGNELTNATQLYTCIFTSLFILSVIVVFGLGILFSMVLKGAKINSLVKAPFVDLSIFYPSSNYRRRDFGAIFFNIILMIGLLICALFFRNDAFSLIALFLVNAFGTTVAFCYSRLNYNRGKRNTFWFTSLAIFALTNVFIFCLYPQAIWSRLPLLVYEGMLMTIIFQLRKMRVFEKDFKECGALNNPAYKLQRWVIKIQAWMAKHFKISFYRQFAFMLVSWFALSALLPTIFMYRYFYLNEKENHIKQVQVDVASKMFTKNQHVKELNTGAGPVKTDMEKQVYLSGFYQTTVGPAMATPCSNGVYVEQEKMNRFLNYFRFNINSDSALLVPFLHTHTDSAIRFCRDEKNITLSYSSLAGSASQNEVIIQSMVPGFFSPSIRNPLASVLYFVVFPLLFLILLFSVTWFFLKRFFLFEILPDDLPDDNHLFQSFYNQYYQNLAVDCNPFKLFVYGVTSSGKRQLIKQAMKYIFEQLQQQAAQQGKAVPNYTEKDFLKEHLISCNLSEIDDVVTKVKALEFKKGQVLVLTHFEHNLADKASNDKKFEIISNIFQLSKNRPHLVILSNIPPSTFLDSLKGESERKTFKVEDFINTQDYYNWTGMLSGFETYAKLYSPPTDTGPGSTASGPFAPYYGYKTRYTFYLSLWNSLDRLEKFVLYDLAKDNLVNFRNKETLFSLYQKGLVVQKDMPAVMNEELSTFVVSEIKEADVELEKQESGIGSAWNTFRTPFLLILLGVLLFVFITQQETFNKLMAAIVAFAGSIPILIKLIPGPGDKKGS